MSNIFSLNLEKVPKELLLLLELMKLDNGKNEKEIDHEMFTDIDWGKFLHLTVHHRVYSFIYPKVKAMDERLIPNNVIGKLYQNYKKNTYQMLYLTGEMEQVSRLFLENNIRTIFLKGPVIAYDLYGNISCRTSSDLDILVPLCQLDKVDELLSRGGYRKDDYFSTVLNDWKWRHHHITYFHAEKKIKLEIHWRLNPGPAKEPNFNELWDRKRKSNLTGFPVYLLGKEDLFFFLVSHGARHGWSRLRWLVDIHQLANKKINWSIIKQYLKKNHCLHVGGQALILASELLKTPVVQEMTPLLSKKSSRRLAQEAIFYLEEMVNLHTDPIPMDVAIYHKRHLFSLMSIQQKLLFLTSFLYPYPEDAEILPLPKILHFLYFPLRPLLWAWRKTRKQVLS